MRLKSTYLFLALAFCLCSNTYGGFIIKTPSSIIAINNTSAEQGISEKHTSSPLIVVSNLFYHYPFHIGGHKGIAIALGILGLLPFSLFFVGTPRMYYGYWLIGAIQFLGFFAAIFGIILVANAPPTTMAIILLSFGCLMYLWHLVDLIRIIANNLLPRKERNSMRRGHR